MLPAQPCPSWSKSCQRRILFSLLTASEDNPNDTEDSAFSSMHAFIFSNQHTFPYCEVQTSDSTYLCDWLLKRCASYRPYHFADPSMTYLLTYRLLSANSFCPDHLPHLQSDIMSRVTFPVPSTIDPLMEVLDQPTLFPADFRILIHLQCFFPAWKATTINFLYGSFTTSSTLSYQLAAKHVTCFFFKCLLCHNQNFVAAPTFHFSSTFDSCFALHPTSSTSDFISLLLAFTYVLLAYCAETSAYASLPSLLSLPSFIKQVSRQYPYCSIPLKPILSRCVCLSSMKFLVRVSTAKHIVISRPQDLPRPLRPHFQPLLKTQQLFPLPHCAAKILAYICASPIPWGIWTSTIHPQLLHINWNHCLARWSRQMKQYLFDLFSQGIDQSHAPTPEDIAFHSICLLLVILDQFPHQQQHQKDLTSFRDAFAVLHCRFPCTTLHNFSLLGLHSLTYVHTHYSCILANTHHSEDPLVQLQTIHNYWPSPLES